MRLAKNEKILARLTRFNELLKKCQVSIDVCNNNYKIWQKGNSGIYYCYSESDMLNDIRRYENLYIYLEKKFTKTLELL